VVVVPVVLVLTHHIQALHLLVVMVDQDNHSQDFRHQLLLQQFLHQPDLPGLQRLAQQDYLEVVERVQTIMEQEVLVQEAVVEILLHQEMVSMELAVVELGLLRLSQLQEQVDLE
jgi:hypothetical protein